MTQAFASTRPRLPLLRTALATCAILAAPAIASAQSFPQLSKPAWSDLTSDDLSRMNAAAARLYEGRSIGTMERWRNPDTNNAGSVQLVGKFETKGLPCWRMDYTIRMEQTKDHPSHYVVNWCKTATGEWKML